MQVIEECFCTMIFGSCRKISGSFLEPDIDYRGEVESYGDNCIVLYGCWQCEGN